jgi:hypothetical protein
MGARHSLLPVAAVAVAAGLVSACGGAVSHAGNASMDSGAPDSAGQDAPGASLEAAADSSVPLVPEAGPGADSSPPLGPGLLLYGGWGDLYQDTWNWSGGSWTQIPGDGPGVLDDQSMIGFGGSVLLFGGEDVSTKEGGTWLWSQGAWSQLPVTGPSARVGGATAVLGGKVYLYGGQAEDGTFLSDMWTWDGTAWSQVPLSGPTPGPRYAHSMAALGGTIVLFGNVGGPTDTWTFDGTKWTQAATVGPTGDPQGLSDSRGFEGLSTLGDRVILFGGEQDANHFLNDTWAWDGTSWTELSPLHQPPARFHPAMATLGDTVVLFGGGGSIPSGQPLLGDTWTFDGTDWTEAATMGPSPRYGYVMAAHP